MLTSISFEIGQTSTAMSLSLHICISFGCLINENLLRPQPPGIA